MKEKKTATKPNALLEFNPSDMEKFYDARQFVRSIDATELVKSSVVREKEEVVKSSGCYRQIPDKHYVDAGILGMMPREFRYDEIDVITEKVSYVSTGLLVDKLDSTLYFWRELNQELLRILQLHEVVEEMFAINLCKNILYMAPAKLAQAQ